MRNFRGWRFPLACNAPWCLILMTILMLLSGPSMAQKTDIITFTNGDRLTVDIKEFQKGKLRVKTIGLGTVYIEHQVIDTIETSKTYQVELESGVRLLGSISRATSGEGIVVQTRYGERAIDFDKVASIQRVKREETFWSRLDGSVQLGINYTSGSEIGQTNFGANVSFVEADYIAATDLSATLTTGSATNDTRRYNWGVDYYRLLKNRWFWIVNTDLDSNDELGIDLRLLAGGGAGRFLIKNNRSRWALSGGLAASKELRSDRNKAQLEGQLVTDYSYYFFTPTKTDLNVSLVLYPGITRSERLRGNFDTKLRWEIVSDLTWDLTYYYTWDNQPPEGAASSDTGITTSLGYTF